MKTCLVLEGGALRGIYTAGVLDELHKENIKIDTIIGVSMGTLIALNYISNQPGRAIRYNKKYCKDNRYISIKSLITTGNLVNKEFAFDTLPNKLDIFDYKTFNNSKIKLYCTVTNIDLGLAEYILIKDLKKDIEYLRAGSSMPGVSKIVNIGNKRYLDGGVVDSIPVLKAIEMGFDKIIVVLTRPIEYRKNNSHLAFLKMFYKNYPNFKKALHDRNKLYNETVEKIISLEKENQIFVIRPSKKINIKRVERNSKIIDMQYNLGITDFRNNKENLKKYLSK